MSVAYTVEIEDGPSVSIPKLIEAKDIEELESWEWHLKSSMEKSADYYHKIVTKALKKLKKK